MDTVELEGIGKAWKRARERADALYEELHEAVVAAWNDGVPTMAISEASGLARELVRRTLKAADEQGRLTRPRQGAR